MALTEVGKISLEMIHGSVLAMTDQLGLIE